MACKEKFAGLLSKLSSTYRSHVWTHFGHPTTETPQGVREVQNVPTTWSMMQHLNWHHPVYSSN